MRLYKKASEFLGLCHGLAMREVGLAVFALLIGAMTAGCAVGERENRHLLNLLDEHGSPKSKGGRIALAPVYVPMATVALAADAVITHPATQIKPAWKDVHDLYWAPRAMEPMRRAILFPFCVVLTPPSFVGDWVARSIFDLD